MIDLKAKFDEFSSSIQFQDFSLEMILLLGLGSSIFLLLLLKGAFISFRRTDERVAKEFDPEEED
ncbi:hypothetical protein RYZ26_13960 [Terasakiella sp. A23]|uniref:hypothetical protein n=1 Tax=Terasakiella sp. FCG-A23 TaxID=3080561 RepID=UPI002953CEAE|nr:hypothetical protein [Terasakiella sp. A23]MDV7340706.1 hypothetical protein [Terasakiella sp. A23]